MKKPVGVEIFDRVAHRYDSISKFLSMGLIPKWQRELVKGIEKTGRVLDLACGTGDVGGLLLGKAESIVGLDYSSSMLEIARKKYPQISFVRGDALNTPFRDSSFDLILVSLALRHFENPGRALKEIRRILKKSGEVRILEVSIPKNPLLKGIFVQFLEKVMLPLGKLRSKTDVTKHLYETIVNFPHYEKLLNIGKELGFKRGSYRPLFFGMVTIYTFYN